MDRIPERNRPLVVAAAGVLVVLLVAGGVFLVGRLGPSPAPSPSLPPAATRSPTPDASTPAGATRAFFDALVAARRTDDPALVEPFVTGRESSAYLTVAGFLAGQKAGGKASIIITNELSGFQVDVQGQTATVMVTQRLGGYDIDLTTGAARESPALLPPTNFRVVLKQVDGRWLVDAFAALA
jgi:hypothetical protein